jgi:hypothetical protein
MELKVPFGYSAEVVERGKRNPVTRYFYEWATVEVPSPSVDDAPVAVAWYDRMPQGDEQMDHGHDSKLREFGLIPDDGQLHTRTFNGAHYWFNVHADRDAYDARHYKETIEQFRERVAKGDGAWPIKGVPRVAGNLLQEHPDGYPLDLSAYREVKSSGRDKALQAIIDNFGDNLIAVDGYIYVKKAEPVYMLYHGVHLPNDDFQLWIKIVPNDPESLNPGNLPYKTVKDVFRIDRYEDARQASFGNFSNQRAYNVNDDRKATVLIDTAIKLDTDSQVMFELARDIVEKLAEQKMKNFSRDEGISYYNLRAAVDAYEQTKDANAIFQAATDYRDCILNNSYSSTYLGKLETIIERHLMKPLSM